MLAIFIHHETLPHLVIRVNTYVRSFHMFVLHIYYLLIGVNGHRVCALGLIYMFGYITLILVCYIRI